MFIKIDTVVSDDDGAPIKTVSIFINAQQIQSIIPAEEISGTPNEFAHWNKCAIKMTSGTMYFSNKEADEIVEMCK